jgi:hypothetical protein
MFLADCPCPRRDGYEYPLVTQHAKSSLEQEQRATDLALASPFSFEVVPREGDDSR